jgi:hypothetical protein
MSGFFSALFGGADSNLNNLISQYGQIGSTQAGQGQKYSTQAGDFWSSILSGDSSKISQSLAPEINSARTSTAQDEKTNSMFNPRSGGTAASNAASTDKLHGYITDLIGNLTGSAATNLGNLGTTMTSTGLGALGQEQAADAQRYQNWMDSIAGKGITTGVAAGEAYALGA